MESKKNNKYGIITIVFATLFMVTQHVLVSVTVIPEYAQNPKRFYMYTILLGLTAIGGNLLALYLGYHANIIKKKNPLQTLPSFYLIYVLLTFLLNLFCKSVNLSDYWKIFFPISQNMFGFAVSFMLIFLLSPMLVTGLDQLSNSQSKTLFTLSSILFVICPTLFGKDIFGFSEGKGVLWIAYLFLVGYLIKRFRIIEKNKNLFLKLVFSGAFICILVILMTKVSLLVHQNASTAARFNMPWSLFSVYFSINCFIFFELVNRRRRFFKANFKIISTFLVVTQILINWPAITNYISGKYKVDFPNSAFDWGKRILFVLILYLIFVLLLCSIIIIVRKIPILKKMESKKEISDWNQIVEYLITIKQWFYNRRRMIYTGLFFYLFTAMQMLLLSEAKTAYSIFRTILVIFTLRQAQLVLNLIIVMLFFLLVFLLTKRFWYAFSFTLTVELLITISNILKIEFRREPILPSDLVFISNLNEILGMVSPVIIVIAVLVLIILVISTFLIQRRTSKTYKLRINNKRRISGIILVGILLSGVLWVNQPNSPSNMLFKLFKINRMYFDQKRGAYVNGPLVQFINNIVGDAMAEPEGYSKENLEKIMKKYDMSAKKINEDRSAWSKDQTVIFVLNESFSDPSRLPGITLKKDPIPFIKSLSEQTTSGLMLSSAYGGGTANVEWQTLTSLDLSNLDATLPNPYTQLVIKQGVAPSILNLFDKKIAIHPYLGSFYNRIDVFKKFGFDSFHYLESPDGLKYTDKIGKNPYVSDEAAYKETLSVIKNNSGNETQFIQLSTMQNHIPYNNFYEENDFDFSGNVVTDTNASSMKTYLKGLNYSNLALEDFINELDKIKKPITLVWYGDHLPGIYNSSEVQKNPLNYRETDYFIYNNSFIQGKRNNQSSQLVSPYTFPALALEQANVKVTPFYAMLTDVAKNLPATTNNPDLSDQNKDNSKKIFVNQKNSVLSLSKLSKRQKELLNDYMLVQYDLVAGKQYTAKWASQKDYK